MGNYLMNTLSQGLFICDTIEETRQAAAACQQWMADHVPGYAGQFWDQPKQRAADGKYSIYVDERVLSALEPLQRERIVQPNPADEWQPLPEG